MATETQEKPRKRLRHKILLLFILILALAAAFFFGAVLSRQEAQPKITTDLIGQQLAGVQELSTVEYFYTNMGRFENQLDFYGWAVPLTRKSFIVSYDGTIKAGINLADIDLQVSGTTVTVTLPPAEILAHEIPEDSIEVFDETHNIFNPIQISDYTGFTRDQKEEVETKAVENGLLEEAARRAQAVVKSLLSQIPGMDEYTLTIK
ncbi:MAG: DUF4230 domain-containing protein [Flavonifractor sp.]|nr:DUF4230 domain-containing protein [Flavonifractor sp.]